jgi:chromosome segregation ATPase
MKRGTATAEAPVETPAQKLTPSQIQDARENLTRQNERLSCAEDVLRRLEGDLARVSEAENNASNFLAQSEESEFAADRARAKEILNHCGPRREKIEEAIRGRKRQIEQIKAEIDQIPTLAVQQRTRLHELASKLRAALP